MSPASRPLTVLVGTAHWSRRWLAEHQIARQLTRYTDVLFVDPDLSRWTAKRYPELAPLLDGANSVVEVQPGLHVVTPRVVPGKDRAALTHLADRQVRSVVARSCYQLSREPVATITTLPGRQIFSGSSGTRIYWAKDDHAAGAGLYGQDPGRLSRSERRLVAKCDHFVVCSEHLKTEWERRGFGATVIPNGCDVSHFSSAIDAQKPTDIDTSHPYAIYLGTITDRIDAAVLRAVADTGTNVLMVGDQRRTAKWNDFAELAKHPRITALGRRSYAELPSYLGAAKVGLVPYRSDAYNRGSFPLKFLEYLAAGLPVVSTDLPAAHWFDSPHVQVAADARTFAAKVVKLVSTTNSATSDACRGLALAHSWSERADRFAGLLGLDQLAQTPGTSSENL